MKIYGLLLIATLVGCSVSATASDISPVVDASARTVELEQDSIVGGQVIAIASSLRQASDPLQPVVGGDMPAIPPRRIVLIGQEVTASTDVIKEPTNGLTPLNRPTLTEGHDYALETSLVATAFRINAYLYIVADHAGSASIIVESGKATVQSAPTGAPAMERWVISNRTALEASPGGGVSEVGASGLRTIRVEGDFRLTVWDIDFEARGPGAGDDLRSGYFYDSTLPVDAPVNTIGPSESRQLYLYVTNGVLELSFDQDPSLQIFAEAKSAHAAGGFQMTDVTGTVQLPTGPEEVARRDVSFDGVFDFTFAGVTADGRLATTATGEPTRAVVGGKPYVYSLSTSSSVSVASFAGWSLAATGLLAIFAAIVIRRRSQSRAIARLEHFMDEGAYARAIAASTPSLVRSRKHGADAQVMRTVSLLCLKRHDEAQAALESWRGARGATVDYLWAFLHAAKGDVAEAKRRITTCLATEPSMRAEIENNPVFQAVLQPRLSARRMASPREGYT